MWRVQLYVTQPSFTYSHANTPLGQSERTYYLSYFIRVDTKYFKQLLSHRINSVEQFLENLDSVVLQKIFQYDDFIKLQDAPLRKDDQFADLFPFRSAITDFSFSWWTFKFVCELNNI